MKRIVYTAVSLSLWTTLWAGPPSLPSGLGPALPSGLNGEKTVDAPSTEENPFRDVTGFFEVRYGSRLKEAPGFSDTSLVEARAQLNWDHEFGFVLLDTSMDLLYDDQANDVGFDLESGKSWVDLRSFSLEFEAMDSMDVKVGRQIVTWGVGDLLFINDLFPKDWNSFFLGRDVEYLKAAQDSLRVSWYLDWANVDFVYSPEFESDRFIDGERLSYFDTMTGSLVDEPTAIEIEKVGDSFKEDELHLRLARVMGRFEYSLYGYSGYWKSPAGVDLDSGRALFPRLAVYGASARGPWAQGVLSMEAGYYDSRDYGKDPLRTVRSSETRLLVGYEKELASELTGSLQYYVERSRELEKSERDRELITLRLSKQMWQQRLVLSVFGFYSPSDYDSYLRLGAVWKATDEWRYDIGLNLFNGEPASFFGQFDRNDNAYFGVRRVF